MTSSSPRRVLLAPKVFSPLGSPEFEAGDPDLARAHARSRSARAEHRASMAIIDAVLATTGWQVERTDAPTEALIASVDLVITAGGDGTFLRSARLSTDTPILGINSAPKTSTGHYCACNAEGFAAMAAAIDRGDAPIALRPRIRLRVDGEWLPTLALNDVLFAHRSPAASSRYILRVEGRSALHLSSGIWIATASGSTAAIHSAGGTVMAPDDERLQFLVREPYRRPATDADTMTHGFVDDAPIAILARSGDHRAFVDGHIIAWPIPKGSWLEVMRGGRPLRVVQAPPSPTDPSPNTRS